MNIRIENQVILRGRDNNQAWFEPAIGAIPGCKARDAEIFVRATLLTGNDVGPQLWLRTQDYGAHWSDPVLCQNWHKTPLPDDAFEEPWFGFQYHAQSRTLIAIGQTHFVRDAGHDGCRGQKNERHVRIPGRRSHAVYSMWNGAKDNFEPWRKIDLPESSGLSVYYNGQRCECADGTLLVPGYCDGANGAAAGRKRVTVLRCAFDGGELRYVEHGSVHGVDSCRGLAEPSLVKCGAKYFMTMRHDLRGYVAASADGLHFDDLMEWRFDDGRELGNHCTQQHWLCHGERLYLVYNRRSKLNNGVFRSRAPLFMAEVDLENLFVMRATERIVLPEKGARMGNFGVAGVGPGEFWVVSGEWQQGRFAHVKPGDRFWVEAKDYNYLRYAGDLLLARVCFEQE